MIKYFEMGELLGSVVVTIMVVDRALKHSCCIFKEQKDVK